MKNQEINNQTTLFRFVSLRSAELTKKENQNKRFIFHPDNQTGAFFNAVQNKESNTTKWDAMRSASENFSAFQDEKEIENINPDYFKLADWIARNKSTLDPKELAEKIEVLEPLDLKLELNLWDNLFFQVLTQKSFYIKEAIIQLLVFNNILKNKTFFIGKGFDAEIARQLLLAKVVLPVELFEENITSSSNNSTNQKVAEREKELAGFIPQEMLEAKEVAEAKNSAQNVEFLLSELLNIEQAHYETYEKEYNSELKAYQEKIKPTIVEYQKKYKEEQRKCNAHSEWLERELEDYLETSAEKLEEIKEQEEQSFLEINLDKIATVELRDSYVSQLDEQFNRGIRARKEKEEEIQVQKESTEKQIKLYKEKLEMIAYKKQQLS